MFVDWNQALSIANLIAQLIDEQFQCIQRFGLYTLASSSFAIAVFLASASFPCASIARSRNASNFQAASDVAIAINIDPKRTVVRVGWRRAHQYVFSIRPTGRLLIGRPTKQFCRSCASAFADSSDGSDLCANNADKSSPDRARCADSTRASPAVCSR